MAEDDHFLGVSSRIVYTYPVITSSLSGTFTGFPRSAGFRTTPVVITYEDSGRLGVVRSVVSLFMGDTGAIDMERVQVQWNNETCHEIIARTVSPTLVCPNWTISNKFNLLPAVPRILTTGWSLVNNSR